MTVTYNQTFMDGQALNITSITVKSSHVPRDGEWVNLDLFCDGEKAEMAGQVTNVRWSITGETHVEVFLRD